MPKFYVGESRSQKFKIFSVLLKLIEGVDYSHSFVMWYDKNLNVYKVAEARGGGSRFVTKKRFLQYSKILNLYEYETHYTRLRKIETWVWRNMGDYSKSHILGLGYMRAINFLFRILRIKKRVSNPFKDDDFSQVCVELSARAIEIGLGVDLPGDVEDYGLIEIRELNEKHAKYKLSGDLWAKKIVN